MNLRSDQGASETKKKSFKKFTSTERNGERGLVLSGARNFVRIAFLVGITPSLMVKVIKRFFSPSHWRCGKVSYSVCSYKALSSGLYCKSFTIIIYDHNDNGLYYKTTIVANLTLARSINYNHKVRCKLKRYLYDHKLWSQSYEFGQT